MDLSDLSVLVVNAGSSSIKCALFKKDVEEPIWKKNLDLKEGSFESLDFPKASLGAVGHRIVHGGEKFVKTTLLTPEVMKDLEKLSSLAPLHNPANLKGVAVVQKLFPEIPQFGVFDTAFHRTLSEAAYTYPLPLNLRKEGVRKYGFHGISYEYASKKCALFLKKKLSDLKLVICHLGSGCSLCAVKEGKSIETTMGMTPLEGLMMAERSGSIDPSILFFLQREKKWTVDQLEKLLNKESGLLGVSEISDDIRDILKKAGADPKAKLSLEMFHHRLIGYIGMMIAYLRGVDAIVFTGGIGEHIASVRQKACEAFAFLGLKLDSEKNESPSLKEPPMGEREISSHDSKIKVLVIPAFEERVIADECFRCLNERFQQSS